MLWRDILLLRGGGGGGAFIYEGVYFLLWRDILLLEGGAFLWRVYGYYYEELYFYVRGILFAMEGYTFTWGGAFLWRVYGYYYEGMYFCVRDILLLEGGTLRQRHNNYYGIIILGLHWGHAWQSMKCTHAQWIIFARGRKL